MNGPQPPRIEEISVEKIVNNAFGFGRMRNGKAVLVPFCLPGEKMRVAVVNESKDYCLGRVEEVLEPSPDRRKPRCRHFQRCGGCDLQHGYYSCQLEIKKSIVAEFLASSGLSGVRFNVIPSTAEWGYRNTAVFHSRNGVPGFYAYHSHDLVEIKECPILQDAILEKAVSVLAAEGKGFQGELKARKDNTELVVTSLDREKNNTFRFGSLQFRVWIKNFFQINTSVIPLWLDEIRRFIEPSPSDEMLDLFSGVGIIGLTLAKEVSHVTGIEEDRASVKRAIINARLNEVDNTYFFSGGVERLISRVKKADKVLIDPPRAGVKFFDIARELVRLNPKVIVYSSCYPSAFFRDLKSIDEAGYRLDAVSLVDMFPQTKHFELLGRFVPKG